MGSRPNGRRHDLRAALRQIVPDPEVLMAVPPRPTERDPADWEDVDAHPTQRAPHSTPDKTGLALVGIVFVAVVIALVLLFVL
jgi:hypothetical protein